MTISAFPILSLYIFTPLAFALIVGILHPKNRQISFYLSMVAVAIQSILTVILVSNYDYSLGGYQFAETYSWIAFFNINYAVAIDAISLIFCILTVIVFWVAYFVGQYETKAGNVRNICFLVSFTGLIGTFLAIDGFLFYVFWEVVIIPAFIIMKFSEYKERPFSFQFLIYSLIGSFAIFAGIVFISLNHLYFKGQLSFSMIDWFKGGVEIIYPLIVFSLMLFGFAVKTPLFPVHSWMLPAYTRSPLSLTVLMSGIFSKLGLYGIIRFLFPLFSDVILSFQFELTLLTVIGTLYAAMIAMYSKTPEKILSYSSMSHLGLIAFGLFSFSQDAIKGSLFQILSHGIISISLFAGLAFLYSRFAGSHKKSIRGVWGIIPGFSFIFILMSLANIALPGTMSFIGEFRILAGAFPVNYFLTGFITISTIFSAIYMLNLIRRVIFGKFDNSVLPEVNDLFYNEYIVFGVLSLTVIFFGVYPHFINLIIDSGISGFVAPYLASPPKPSFFV